MKQFILTALLSTTILSSSLTLPAIAGGHSSQKAIGETTAPVRYFDGGDWRIRRYGRTNGRTLDLPRDSVGGRMIADSGQLGGEISSQARHFAF
jgi:hypothetical protein